MDISQRLTELNDKRRFASAEEQAQIDQETVMLSAQAASLDRITEAGIRAKANEEDAKKNLADQLEYWKQIDDIRAKIDALNQAHKQRTDDTAFNSKSLEEQGDIVSGQIGALKSRRAGVNQNSAEGQLLAAQLQAQIDTLTDKLKGIIDKQNELQSQKHLEHLDLEARQIDQKLSGGGLSASQAEALRKRREEIDLFQSRGRWSMRVTATNAPWTSN